MWRSSNSCCSRTSTRATSPASISAAASVGWTSSISAFACAIRSAPLARCLRLGLRCHYFRKYSDSRRTPLVDQPSEGRIWRRRRTRSSIGGWVLKRFASALPAAAGERLDDVEALGRLVDLHRDRLAALLEPQQRRGEALGVAADLGAGRVGRVLALAGDRELDDRRGDRGEQDQRQRGDQAQRALVVAAEPQQHVAEVGDRAADRRGDRLDQRVAVADVGELVGDARRAARRARAAW